MAPVEFSAEWNASCADRPATIRDDSLVSEAYWQFDYFVIAFTVSYYLIGLGGFWVSQRKIESSYLKKRNLFALILATIGAFCILACGPIRDIVGRQQFPCVLTLWLRVFGVVNVLLPISTRLIFFREQMLWSKAKKSISFQKLQEIISVDNAPLVAPPRKSIFRTNNPLTVKVAGSDVGTKDSFDEPDHKSEVTSQTSENRKGLSSGASSTDDEEFERLMARQGLLFRAAAILLPTTPLFVFAIVYQVIFPYYRANCLGCYEQTIFYVLIGATVSVLVAVAAVVGYSIRNSPDPLGLLHELKWLVMCAAPFGATGLLLDLLDEFIGRPYDQGHFSFDWIVLTALYIEFAWLTYVPLVIAYKMNQKVAGARYDFISFLNNPRAYKLFAEHLVNEWAIENLKFWTQVETFRNQYPNFKKVKDGNLVAVQTFNTFIKPGAVMDVNIASGLRDKLVAYFEEHAMGDPDFNTKAIPPTVFDEAQREVFMLMEKDSFQRFQNTKAFKDFVTDNTVLDAAKQRMVVVNPSTVT